MLEYTRKPNWKGHDLDAWGKILRHVTEWPTACTSYRSLARITSLSRTKIKRLRRDWPQFASVLDILLERNRRFVFVKPIAKKNQQLGKANKLW